MSEEYLRFDFEPVRNPRPVLTYECRPGPGAPHHDCTGRNWMDVSCQCWCHRSATCRRSQVE